METAQVQHIDTESNETLRAGFIDSTGNCTFKYVPKGFYTLRVVNAFGGFDTSKLLTPKADSQKTIHYGPAKTKVQVDTDVKGVVLRVAKVTPS